MKKILAVILAAMMLLSVVACGTADDVTTDAPGTDAPGTDAPETGAPEVELPYKSAEELVGQIFSKIPEDNQFPGGGAVIELGSEDAEYTLTDLGLPADLHNKIDSAYQYRHMMNGNTFSMGVYHFVNADDAKASAEAIKNTVMNKEWVCGFAEKVVVITLPGNYVASIYGLGGLDPDPNFATDLITPVIDAARAVVDGVEVVVDQAIA